ncbi:MAG: HAMP domain-containing histidine kinase [Bacteroidetes bacterium]|nr:HAMP domain-containing histidine kinase [Bacteroidota bacterium]
MKLPFTKTIRRNAVLIATAFFTFLLVFNILLYFLITYQLTSVLDSKIRHEIEHIWSSFEIKNNSLHIIRPSEFEESDLVELNDNPFFLQIYSVAGQMYLQSENIRYFDKIPLSYPEFSSVEYFENTQTTNELVRAGYRKLFNKDKLLIGYMQLSARRLRLVSALENIFYYNLLLMPLIFMIIVIVSVYISKKTVKPINSIIKTANRISAINLKERLEFDSDPEDEMSKLKSTLNNLFERLENQIHQISAFSDNASHQLMTPLTAINAELDYAIKKDISDEELKQSLIIAREQSERLVAIIKSLLIMARAGKDNYNNNYVFLLDSLIDKFIRPLFSNYNLQFLIQKDIYIRGREENFTIVLQNLIDNAIKYSDHNSIVTVASIQNGNKTEIIISDNGIGIPDDEKSKVFERFYRSKQTEKLGITGYGLGLCLVKSIILSMNGTIDIFDNIPSGTKIKIILPALAIE